MSKTSRFPTCEIDVRIGDGCGQRSGDDSAKIDEKNPPPSMDHLQGDSEDQLDQDVEDDVEVAAVHEHVRQETPNFPFPVRIEDLEKK